MAANSYLILRPAAVAALTADLLSAGLSEAPIASLLFERVADLEGEPSRLSALVKAGQNAGAAVLFDNVAIARVFNADGVHLAYQDDADAAASVFTAARNALGAGCIVGANAGQSRHHAMVLGELGADYIAFDRGEPARQVELVGWWADLFEPPCVAWDVTTLEQCQSLLMAQADFIAVSAAAPAELAQATGRLARWLGGGA
jgi:thiamine-phosphate pyrophosphorylase